MKLAIVAYPTLDEADRQWIESFRSQYDPHAARLGVHFTLVFPFPGSPGAVREEVRGAAAATQPIPFSAQHHEVVRDTVAGGYNVLLVPDDGRDSIAALHDRLCAGVLTTHLRRDIPFVPHMTVAAARDSESASRLADQLAAVSRPFRGSIDRVDLVDVDMPRVRSVMTFTLAR